LEENIGFINPYLWVFWVGLFAKVGHKSLSLSSFVTSFCHYPNSDFFFLTNKSFVIGSISIV